MTAETRYAEQRGALVKFVQRKGFSLEDAEDAVQDMYFDLHKAEGKGDGFLYAMAWRQAQSNRPLRGTTELPRQRAGADPFVQADQRADIIDALNTLTKAQRRVWMRYHVNGMTQREIADSLDISQPTVYRFLSEADAKMKGALS